MTTPPTARRGRRSGPPLAAATTAVLALAALASGASPAQAAPRPATAPVVAPTVVAVPDPVVRYTFDDLVPGATTTRNSGTGGAAYDATVVNGAALRTGSRDGAATLALPGGPRGSADASMPYLEVPHGSLAGATGLTVSTWVDWDGRNSTSSAAPWAWIVGGDQLPANNRGVFWSPSENGLNTVAANDGREFKANAAAALPADRWMQLTVVEDGTTLSLYVDGALTESRPAPTAVSSFTADGSTFDALIGRTQWSTPYASFFGGQLDDFTIWGQALDGDQVAGLAGTPATLTGLRTTNVDVTTDVAVAPQLPATVDGTYTDDYDRPVPVTWDAVPPSAYAQQGTFTVHGTAGGAPVTATVAVALSNTMHVDLGTDTGAFMGGASGTLYGVYGGLPTSNLLEGIKLRTVATKAQDGPQHPGADALEVLAPVVDSSGGDVYIYMTDIYRGFPYEWPGDTPQARLADYMAKMKVEVDQVAALPQRYRDHVVFVPFNEPEGNMFGTGQWSYDGTSWLDDPTDYFAAWDAAYRQIRSVLPTARIAGPNTSILFDQVQGFLRHALAAGTMPDVITWHELSNPASIRTNVERFRSWETTLYAGTSFAGKHLPINIDEYAFNYHTSVPGQMIQWFSALEDEKVDGDIAYWNIDGNLSDSAVQANRGNGQWWLLHAYASMTGHTVAVTPPHPGESYTMQGIATLDPARKQARVLLGGAAGAAQVDVSGVDPAVFGTTAHVAVKEIGWTGQVGDSSGPAEVAELDVPVVDGRIGVIFGTGTLPALTESSAYQLVVTPGARASTTAAPPALWTGTYEAEDATHTGTGYSVNGPEGSPTNQGGFYTSGGYDVGGLRTGSDVTLSFSVDVPTTGRYDLSVFANADNLYDLNKGGRPNVFLTVDGAAEQELFLPLAYKWVVWDHSDTTVELTAGKHTLTLAARSLDGTRSTQGDAIVDKLDLSLPNPAASVTTYEGEEAWLAGGAQADYTKRGVSGSGSARLEAGASATFWVYSPDDGEHRLSLDLLGHGAVSVTVNGQAVGKAVDPRSFDVALEGGVNKVVVTGLRGSRYVDRLRVGPSAGALPSTTVQAETGVLGGTATTTAFSQAQGTAVTGVGGAPGNANTLTLTTTVPAAGTYAVTMRFSNGEQSPASHYNPDPVDRWADIAVNGASPTRVWFPHTFNDNDFWDRTVYLSLKKGRNTLRFSSTELPDWDGTTYISQRYPDLGLRSQLAPNLDWVRFTPVTTR